MPSRDFFVYKKEVALYNILERCPYNRAWKESTMAIKIADLTAYDVDELAELLGGITPKTIRAYIKSGHIRGRKIARKWYVTEENLQAYLRGENQSKRKPRK